MLVPTFRRATVALATFLAGALLAAPPPHAQGPSVATSTSEKAPIVNRVRLTGTVVSPRTAQLSSDVGGLVQEVMIDLGDRVAKGDPVVQLDAELYRLRYKSAKAEAREAEGELEDAERRVRIARRLARNNNLPQNELDAREAQLRIAKAKVERLKAEQQRWQARVQRHRIKAPFDGVITSRMAETGEWIDPGDPIAELVDIDHLRVDAAVPQQYFPTLGQNPRVSLRFDALPNRNIEAEVIARVPLSDPTARTFTLRLRPTVDNIPLTPGMSARVIMRLNTGERGVVIPRDALMRYPDGRTTVWVTNREDGTITVSERQIQIGRAFDGRIHVRGGLKAGREIVVRGNESLRPGQKVTVVDEGT